MISFPLTYLHGEDCLPLTVDVTVREEGPEYPGDGRGQTVEIDRVTPETELSDANVRQIEDEACEMARSAERFGSRYDFAGERWEE